MKFKKISAVLGTILMTGLTLGTAAAASYPAPFVENGVADVAIVYGTGAGVSSLDMVQAGNIQTSLASSVKGGTTTVEGGESFTLEKTSDSFNYGNDLDTIFTSLDDEDMDFLADGTYDDGDIDETYTQSITLSDATLELFADTNFNDKEPTVGFQWADGDDILTYSMEFDDAIVLTDMNETDLPLMGKEYYVLSATADTIELLDSAEKVSIMEGESLSVGGKTISIYSIDSTGVRFTVDGENTDKMGEHDFEELEDESYIVVNTFTYDTRDGKDSFAEFSIGAGKMTLANGEEIEINDEAVDGLTADFTVDGITITWSSDDETFLAEGDSITMPTFEAISLVYGGLDFPDAETIAVENGETLTLSMGNFDLPLMWFDGTNTTALGEENGLLKLATAANLHEFNATGWGAIGNLTGGLELQEDNRFLVTSMDTDLSDVETIYYEVSNIDYNSDADFEVTLNALLGDKDLVFDDFESHDAVGDIEVTLVDVDTTYAYFTIAGTSLSYNKVVSDKGLVATLPISVSDVYADGLGESTITFTEADKDDDLAEGTAFTVTVKTTTNDALHVSATNVSTLEDADDVYVGYVASDLASKVTLDKNADEYDFEIEYYGSEVTAEVMVVAGAATIGSGTDALGDVLVKDTEVDSVKAKNLVIVGGSCINSAAATVLGGAYCGAAFTAETGVSAGQFLIKGVQDAYTTGKLALVVAGYEAADTVNAATYLTKKDVDTSKTYKGTSATNAELVVAA